MNKSWKKRDGVEVTFVLPNLMTTYDFRSRKPDRPLERPLKTVRPVGSH
jgi:hypothetical protein